MSDCSLIPECDFYHDRLNGMPVTADFMKMEYCYKQYDSCARYLINRQKTTVMPKDLMPFEIDRVRTTT
jgi:hypothetical protein